MLTSPPELPPRYRLERLLGQGAQGHTYLARDQETDREVAVKVFNLSGAETWKGFDLFERECRVLRSLAHPGVVAYLEHGGDEAAGSFYLVMEYAPGQTLEQQMQAGGRFTDDELIGLLTQLLATLEYLHSLNPPVFHRDIKPANIVVGENGTVKLVDFGGVRDVFSNRAQSTVVGTFGYMAPEQLRGEATPASDLYGLGAALAAVATGTDAAELPYAGLELDLDQCIKPGPVRNALRGMLRADPRARTANAAEVRALLQEDGAQAPVRSAAIRPAVEDNPMREVESLAASGDTSPAIRLYRELTGAPLREASSVVRALNVRAPPASKQLAPITPGDQRTATMIASVPMLLIAMSGPVLFTSSSLATVLFVELILLIPLFFALRFLVGNVFRGYRSED